jgi:cytochrome c oxidase cbb3-type subunit III
MHRFVYAAGFLCSAAAVMFAGLGGITVASAASGAPQQRSGFNSGPARAEEDPSVVEHGKELYGVNCQVCHGKDLRGGDMGGPNLLRSQAAMTDQHGENIVPIIQGARVAQGMPNIGLNNEDAGAVAAYIRAVVGTIGGQGRPPGETKAQNIVVGDAGRGEKYFQAHCASCHSVDGDLKGVATKYSEPIQLQAKWVSGGGSTPRPAITPKVDVMVSPQEKIEGDLVRIDDYLVTVRMADGSQRSFRRNGTVPQVVVKDPLQAHRDLMLKYTDDDIHDVTAYLVTLK